MIHEIKLINALFLTFITSLSMNFSINFNNQNHCVIENSIKKVNSVTSFYDSEDEIIKASKFDCRDELTPIKDQGSTNLCWAYSAINASEASILKNKISNKDTLRLNPQALAYRRYVRNSDPLNNNYSYHDKSADSWATNSGSIQLTAPLLSMWQGPVEGNKPALDVYENSLYRLESANLISSGLNGEDRILEIKKAIARYGAVTASCSYDGGTKLYYNDLAANNVIPHAITLIGWDDSIDKSLFKPGNVNRNGGWLVKNSYNDNSYFYLTYESKISDSTSWTFSYVSKETYDFNYYYDNNVNDFGLLKLKSCANVYEAKKGEDNKNEYIEAINVGIYGNDVDVNVKIYTDLSGWGQTSIENGTLRATKTQKFKYGGYQTIKLDSPILINRGSYFSIVIEVSNPTNNAYISAVQSDSKKPSFSKSSYGYDYILNGGYVARIKAYTKCKAKIHIHEWNEPTYLWSKDSTKVTAKRICKLDSSHFEEETVNTNEEIIKNPSCIEKGEKIIRTEAFKNKNFKIQSKKIVLGYGNHVFSSWIKEKEPTYNEYGIKAHKECTICHKNFDEKDNEILDLNIPKLEKFITISVINGSTSTQNVKPGTSVTIKADSPKEGTKFVCWKNENGNILSTDEEYTFVAYDDLKLIAVYEEIEKDSSIPTEDSNLALIISIVSSIFIVLSCISYLAFFSMKKNIKK